MAFSVMGLSKIPGINRVSPRLTALPDLPFVLRMPSASSADVKYDVWDKKCLAMRGTLSPRCATYATVPGGALWDPGGCSERRSEVVPAGDSVRRQKVWLSLATPARKLAAK